MKLSQPKSARTINTARVLNLLRTGKDLSRAEIARLLELNKVSVGEIIEDLCSSGLVKETEKGTSTNGRKPTIIEIVPDCFYVLAVNIGSRFVTTALFDLLGNTIKIERIPSVNTGKAEEFVVNILKSSMRTLKLVPPEKIKGCCITVGGILSEDGRILESCSYLPWNDIPLCEVLEKNLELPVIMLDSTMALVEAEKLINPELKSCEPTMYVNWGSSLSMALVSGGRVMSTSYGFGHLKVSETGLCTCGGVGCLEANASSWAISGNLDDRLRDIWPLVSERAIDTLANALKLSSQVTGASNVIIGGDGSTISARCLNYLCVQCKRMRIKASELGDKAVIQSTAEAALDKWFYMTSMLQEVADYI